MPANISMKPSLRLAGNALLAPSMSSGAITPLLLVPDLFERTASASDSFKYFRFTKFKYRITPASRSNQTDNTDIAVGYATEALGSVPNHARCGELVPCAHFVPRVSDANGLHSFETTPSDWVSVPRALLLGETPTRWWRANDASPTVPEDTIQGSLYGLSANSGDSGAIFIEVQYVCEFAGLDVAGL